VRIESVSQLSDSTLKQELSNLAATDRGTTVRLLVHIAEFDVRKLYLADGYASMYAYSVGELRMSEDIACKRIRAARAARRFPFMLHALAEGSLRLSGVVMLAPHLTEATAEELLAAAFDRTNAEIERLLAERFPRPDVPTLIVPLSPTPALPPSEAPAVQLEQGVGTPAEPTAMPTSELSAARRIEVQVPRPRVTPTSPGRFALQAPLRQETHDLLRDVQDLLGHEVAAGDVDAVLNFALRAAKQKLLQRKCAATERPRGGGRRSNSDSRHIPAEVQRAVWHRDGGQCTFTSDTGHRCEERKDLQFDHIDPYAKDGEPTVGGIRLLCRAHNLYEAERAFGAEFMRRKRLAAAEARAAAKARAAAAPAQTAAEHALG
jgi:5-methylcytosine-specific restriction endonuclease McrA